MNYKANTTTPIYIQIKQAHRIIENAGSCSEISCYECPMNNSESGISCSDIIKDKESEDFDEDKRDIYRISFLLSFLAYHGEEV